MILKSAAPFFAPVQIRTAVPSSSSWTSRRVIATVELPKVKIACPSAFLAGESRHISTISSPLARVIVWWRDSPSGASSSALAIRSLESVTTGPSSVRTRSGLNVLHHIHDILELLDVLCVNADLIHVNNCTTLSCLQKCLELVHGLDDVGATGPVVGDSLVREMTADVVGTTDDSTVSEALRTLPRAVFTVPVGVPEESPTGSSLGNGEGPVDHVGTAAGELLHHRFGQVENGLRVVPLVNKAGRTKVVNRTGSRL